MVAHSDDRQVIDLVLFYEICRSLPILHDATIRCVYPRFVDGFGGVSKADLQHFFDESVESHP